MGNTIKKIYSFFLISFKLFKVPSYYWCKVIHRYDIPISKIEYKKGNRIYLEELDVMLSPKNKQNFLLQQYALAKRLKEQHRAKFINSKPGEILVEIGDEVRVAVKTIADFFILEEIFTHGVYNILFKEDIIIWDIGCNIGMASLFFAQKKNVKKIYAFEPFKQTFNAAKQNFDLNPHLSEKIFLQNAGISDETKELELEYSSEFTGNVGVMGLNENLRVKTQVSFEKVKFLSASDVASGILKQAGPLPVVVKMDCEGSEYEILKSLSENNLLNRIHVLMIEWHAKGPGELENYLTINGFVTFSLSPFKKDVGFIYAVNSRMN